MSEIKYGDEIAVNGVRPLWLKGEDLPKGGLLTDMGWRGEGDYAHPIENWAWPVVKAIRLTKDHWAYAVIAEGLEPWGGGDQAPEDWDGGTVMFRMGYLSPGCRNLRWDKKGFGGDIVGYRKRVDPEFAEVDEPALESAMPPEWAIKRARGLLEKEQKSGIGGHVNRAFARYIAEHEPEPIDPDMVLATHVANNSENANDADWYHAKNAALAAIKMARQRGMMKD